MVGTMIELPRAALVADEIAKEAEFFSFGTNDLTQTTFGFSRDDVNKVLPTYLAEGILKQDPFAALDREGVGQLVRMATERGRKTRPNLKVGICGEHGGEPSSVEFCHQVGLNYVSCSPFRVLTARLAAAQAAAADTLKVRGRKNEIESNPRGMKVHVSSNLWQIRRNELCVSDLCGFTALSAGGRSVSEPGSPPTPTTSRRALARVFFSAFTVNSTSLRDVVANLGLRFFGERDVFLKEGRVEAEVDLDVARLLPALPRRTLRPGQ